MRRLPFFVLPLCLLLLLLLPAAALAAPKPTFDKAIDQLFAQGYPQGIDTRLISMPGTNPQWGFYWAGTCADNARAVYLAKEMRAIGLTNVHLDPVPVDVFNFKSASVADGASTFVASTFAGIRPTPRKGITGQVVYAHEGTAAAFNALAAAHVRVAGKIVLLDADPTNFWMNDPAKEATYRGASGIIFTYGPTTPPYWTFATDELASFDSEFDLSDAPAVYICQRDGDLLRSQLNGDVGPVVTMKLDETVQMATHGGTGYNVVGDLPGKSKDDSFVLFAAHHDAHFWAPTDDGACVSNLMAIAKAMRMSGYRGEHTVRFMITTGEEFGYTNCYNDWCIGAWYAITQAHPDWAGKIRAFFNEDYFSGSVALGLTSPDFAPYLKAETAANASLLTYGSHVGTVMSTWNDGWTFAAAGVPTVSIGSVPPNTDNGRYHSQYMQMDELNWPWIANISKFVFRAYSHFNDGSLLPYNMKAQADNLANAVVADDLTKAGAAPAAISRVESDVTAYQNACAAYETRASSIPPRHYAKVDRGLRRIEKTSGLEFTGQTPFETTVWRHSQSLLDVQCLDAAIGALQTNDTASALGALAGVDWTYIGLMVSHPVYLQLLTRLDPSYDRVIWGAQGNPVWPLLDVMPQYKAIQAGTWNLQTIAQLAAMRDQDLTDLNARLNAMSAALEKLIPRVNALK